MSENQADWRPIVAALNNPQTRRVYAQVVLGHEAETLGDGLSPARRRHVLESLVKAGLISKDGDGYRDRSEVFTQLLAAIPRPADRTGPERFLNGRGEIDRYPSDATELHGLLAFIAGEVLTNDDVLTEKELNERLTPFSQDTAGLRRRLVDAELLDRTPSGSQYSRVAGAAVDQASAEPAG
ncbi:DUF2087 domain-containing protein [Ruania zhangjianzhongii]|uniref:DUF2087 domain-containing protein n=1 Tax=Ruania zhangjianzhongii TaxID=2603206 RepID=UPI0011CAB670|nr:DUF2087 domain-containing protein [Ruania zhangjianzhongii]